MTRKGPPPSRNVGCAANRPKLKSPKNKGSGYERELAAYFNDSCSLRSFRTPLSGGGFGFARDVAPTADLTGTPNLWVEAKRVERLNFHEAMAQAERGSDAHGRVDMPVVINRKNYQALPDSLCVLRLKDFIKLYDAYLKTHGLHPPPRATLTEEGDDLPETFPH